MFVKKPPPPDPEDDTEPLMDQVIAWRVQCFERFGFAGDLALRLASDRTVDLRRMERALASGLSHTKAADLLGPLDD